MNAWRRFGAFAALVALLLCVVLIAAQRPAAAALCIVLALGVFIEGAALILNWRGMAGSTVEQTSGLGEVLQFRRWEVRVIVGGFYAFMGLLFLGAGIHYL